MSYDLQDGVPLLPFRLRRGAIRGSYRAVNWDLNFFSNAPPKNDFFLDAPGTACS